MRGDRAALGAVICEALDEGEIATRGPDRRCCDEAGEQDERADTGVAKAVFGHRGVTPANPCRLSHDACCPFSPASSVKLTRRSASRRGQRLESASMGSPQLARV